jgi:hypothetical protein
MFVTGHGAAVPDLFPMLSRGKHRNPRKGACFMELASFLAGERWSDHPACTHPLLASVARLVNDYTTDEGRTRLAGLIPSVVGLTSDDPRVDARIALRAATTALPVVSADRQRAMAASVLSAEAVLAELDGRPVELGERSRWALAQAPDAHRWAVTFACTVRMSTKRFNRRSAPSIVRVAAEGLARACVPNPDAHLYALLSGAIEETTAATHPNQEVVPVDEAAWTEACRLTGATR